MNITGHAPADRDGLIAELADRFGTPLYVYDADVMRRVYQRLRGLLDPRVDIMYSAKANPNISVCAVMHSLGAGLEVSSLAELITAVRAGVPGRDIIFLGPGKSREELQACCAYGIRAVACESLDELAQLQDLHPPRDMRIMLRINPAFQATGSRLAMGGKPRQFGIDQELLLRTEASSVVRRSGVTGIHAYLGTRILDPAAIIANTCGILGAAEDLASTIGFPLDVVDIGGGLGVPYFDGEEELDIGQTAEGVNDAVASFRARHQSTQVITELGRYLVALSGTYVVRARYVKESRGEWFVVTDGGTNHHMAAVGIGSFVKRNFPVRSLSRRPASRTYTVTGPLCTPNDVVGKRVALPEVRPGDLLAVDRSGAYGPSASPVLFLSHGHPAEALIINGGAHLIRSRDTVEDLLRNQHLAGRDQARPVLVTEGISL
jgi:diaminopimelate decarboxylase